MENNFQTTSYIYIFQLYLLPLPSPTSLFLGGLLAGVFVGIVRSLF